MDEIKLKLIFTNNVDLSPELTTSLGTTVKDVKQNIMDSWPQPEDIERVRLFAAGKELGGKGGDDLKSLRDAKIVVSQNFPTPVHVCGVAKSAVASERGRPKQSQCFCALL
uniref:UBL3-like ubiquitin domain-containing protein n=1 Tax=Noctiluca scintillans TaxID=2966 RepID=A0A7S1AHT8_NOCSC|mmetsp:Transcript_46848/g.124451  ORF Transcript_46848/g.124451 Transcript_46848/m.124451 type:complete len:111 (+) Transcript_46848:60-392(+)